MLRRQRSTRDRAALQRSAPRGRRVGRAGGTTSRRSGGSSGGSSTTSTTDPHKPDTEWPFAYVYEEPGVYDDMGQDAHIAMKDAKGGDTSSSTLATLGATTGTGASIGSVAGTAIPIPGVGNAIGTAVGASVGAIVGGIKSIFGGGPDETKMRNVLPILLAKALKKKGAQVAFKYPHNDKRGKGGLLVGKMQLPKRKMLDVVKEIQSSLGGTNTHATGDAARYNQRLKVSESPPSNLERVIVAFPRPLTTAEIKARTEEQQAEQTGQGSTDAPTTTTPTTTTTQATGSKNARIIVYGVGALAAVGAVVVSS